MRPASEPSTFAELVFDLAFGFVLLIIGAIYAAPTLVAFPATTFVIIHSQSKFDKAVSTV
jgi:hypothetical protein